MQILKPIALTSSVFVLTIFATPQAFGQESNQPDELQAIYACKSINDSQERLACYDNSVGRFQAAEKSGELVAVSKTAIEKVEREAFGFNIPSLPSISGIFGGNKKNSAKENDLTAPVKQAERVKDAPKPTKPPAINKKPTESKVTDVILDVRKTTEFGRGKTRFFMTNGQVWEQVGTSRARIPEKKAGKEYRAEISKAALDSFLMRVNGKGTAIRIRRVR